MEHTCSFPKCHFAKFYKMKKPELCPSYIMGTWIPAGQKEPVVIHDCAPRRLYLSQKVMMNQIIGLQQDQNKLTNSLASSEGRLVKVCTALIKLATGRPDITLEIGEDHAAAKTKQLDRSPV